MAKLAISFATKLTDDQTSNTKAPKHHLHHKTFKIYTAICMPTSVDFSDHSQAVQKIMYNMIITTLLQCENAVGVFDFINFAQLYNHTLICFAYLDI